MGAEKMVEGSCWFWRNFWFFWSNYESVWNLFLELYLREERKLVSYLRSCTCLSKNSVCEILKPFFSLQTSRSSTKWRDKLPRKEWSAVSLEQGVHGVQSWSNTILLNNTTGKCFPTLGSYGAMKSFKSPRPESKCRSFLFTKSNNKIKY